MHMAKAAATLPVRSTVSYPLLILSVNARAVTPATAPLEAYNTAFLGPSLRPLEPEPLRYDPLPDAKLLAWRYRDGLPRANWLRQVEHVHGREPMRVATAEAEKALIWTSRWGFNDA